MTHMQILGALLFLFNRCIICHGGFLITNNGSYLKPLSSNGDLGFGFLMFRCFTEISTMFYLLFIFILGFVLFLGEFRGKSNVLKYGFYSGFDVSGICCLKILSWKISLYGFSKSSPSSSTLVSFEGKKEIEGDGKEEENQDDDDDEEKEEEGLEALKRMIEIERERANTALSELEQERISASSSADEAMAMILRLQSEKNQIEIEANQYKRLAKHKQRYDQEVIRSLRWIVSRHESERSILLNQLKLCKQRLEKYLKIDEGDSQLEELDEVLNWAYSTIEDDELTGPLVSSLDMDSSMM